MKKKFGDGNRSPNRLMLCWLGMLLCSLGGLTSSAPAQTPSPVPGNDGLQLAGDIAPSTRSVMRRVKPELTEESLVYVLPIEGEINELSLILLRRGLAKAKSRGVSALLLEMDTPGGKVTTAELISKTLLETDFPTITWIKNQGLSAGMLIAISTQQILMHDLAVIGDCQPIMMAPSEIQEAPEKILTVIRTYAQRATERNGYPTDVIMAMIDKDLDFNDSATGIKAGPGKILTLTAREAQDLDVSSGIANSREEVFTRLGLAVPKFESLERNWAENVAWIISRQAVASILTAIALVFLFIEYKTPGFGFFGSTGLLLFALVFWGHALAHLAGYEGAIVFLIGLVFLAIELFVLPGFGIAGMTGIACIMLGLVLTFLRVPLDSPFFIPEVHLAGALYQVLGTLLGAAVLSLLAAIYLPHIGFVSRSGLSLQSTLDRSKGYHSYSPDDDAEIIGLIGKTVTSLRPSGIATIEGKRRDVISQGEFIPANTPVEAVGVKGTTMIVKAQKKDTVEDESSG